MLTLLPTLLTLLLFLSPFSLADIPPLTNSSEFTTLTTSYANFPSQTFRSSPLTAPIFLLNRLDASRASNASHIFLGTVYGTNKAGPMVFDARDLSLVYADQRYENTYASNVYTINGTRFLAFWEGGHTRGHANGNCLFFDEAYTLRYNVTAQGLNDAMADMHELSVTETGTVIFSTYFNIPFDCRPVGGPEDALLMDSGFQEIDLATGELVFDWHASKWFAIDQSYAEYSDAYGVSPDSGFDFFHINSIQKASNPSLSHLQRSSKLKERQPPLTVNSSNTDRTRRLPRLRPPPLHPHPHRPQNRPTPLDPRRQAKPIHRPLRRRSHKLFLAARRPHRPLYNPLTLTPDRSTSTARNAHHPLRQPRRRIRLLLNSTMRNPRPPHRNQPNSSHSPPRIPVLPPRGRKLGRNGRLSDPQQRKRHDGVGL